MQRNDRELKEKQAFVADLSKAYSAHVGSVESMSYEIFVSESESVVQEYLVIRFRGGETLARNSNANSLYAIACDAAKLMNGGYYEEVGRYRSFEAKIGTGDWFKL